MIGKLTGTVAGTDAHSVILDVQGVGYCVRMSLGALLTLKEGGPLSLFVHTAVRDDAIDLYGFQTQEELTFFKLLMSVQGVGPKTALGILNVADVKTLKRSIAQGDASTLTKVFGIGKKSAERIVVELRDKLKDHKGEAVAGDDGEVIEALMALGYRAEESRRALGQVQADVVGVRERLSAALKNLGNRQLS